MDNRQGGREPESGVDLSRTWSGVGVVFRRRRGEGERRPRFENEISLYISFKRRFGGESCVRVELSRQGRKEGDGHKKTATGR